MRHNCELEANRGRKWERELNGKWSFWISDGKQWVNYFMGSEV